MTIAEQVLADRASISDAGTLARIRAKYAQSEVAEPRSTPPARVERRIIEHGVIKVGKRVEGRKCEGCKDAEAVANCEFREQSGRTAHLCWDCIDDANRLDGPRDPDDTRCEICQEAEATTRAAHPAYPKHAWDLCQDCVDAVRAYQRGEAVA